MVPGPVGMIEFPDYKVQTFGAATVEAGIISARTAELACEASAGLTCTVVQNGAKLLVWVLFFGAKLA